jgi:hypothetical protein
MLALLIATASAAPMIASVGEDVTLSLGGGWARAVPAGDGSWRLLWAAGGDYNVVPMTADLVAVDRDRLTLTGRSDLQDHAFAPCADGSWLHVASASVDVESDTLYAWRNDADLEPLEAGSVAAGTSGQHNDPAALCAGADVGLDLAGVGFGKVNVYRLGEDAATTETVELYDAPQLMGGSILWEEETASIVMLGVVGTSPLRIVRYDADLQLVEAREMDLPPEGEHAYWPQSVVRVGVWYVVAYMSRDLEAGYTLDTGNVHLAVFDLGWNLAETAQVTDWAPPEGGMRPSLALQGDRLVVLYDRANTPHAVPVTLDLAAFGLDAGDDPAGEDPGGDDAGDDDAGSPDEPLEGGAEEPMPSGADDDGDAVSRGAIPASREPASCAVGGGAPGLLGVLLALAAARGRRRAS